MKNLKLLAAALAVILAGCAQTPDSVRSSAEKDSKERNEITAIQYISSNKLSDDIDNALDKSYTQFDLRENISVKLPEDCCEVDFTQISDYEENYEKIMTRIFGKDVLDRENTVHDETGDGMVSYSFSDDDGKMYGCVGNNGFICFAKPSAFDDLFNGGNRVKIYHIDRDDDLSDSYELDGTSVTIKQAVDFAQDWLDKNYADLEPDLEIAVKTIIVRQSDQGIYSFDIHASKKYNGVLLDDLVQMTDTSDESMSKMKYITQGIYMQMFKSDEIGSLTNGNGILIPKKERSVDKIISLSSAMGFIENTFTDFNEKMEISAIDLKYTLTPLNDNKNGQSCYDAGIKFDSHLVWEFVMEVPENEMPVGDEYSSAGNIQRFIYLDAESGDLDYEFDINMLMQ